MTHTEFFKRCHKFEAQGASKIEIRIEGGEMLDATPVQYEGYSCPNLCSLFLYETMTQPEGVVVGHLEDGVCRLSIENPEETKLGDLILQDVYVQSRSSVAIFEFITQV